MNHKEYTAAYNGTTLVKETEKLGTQCVAQAKHYSKKVNWITLKGFNGSALQGWKTWSPFVWTPYTRVEYKKWMTPSVWDIIFFDLGTEYGHVCIVDEGTTTTTLARLEQNMGNGDGQWYDDRMTQRKTNYKGVVWWYTLKPTVWSGVPSLESEAIKRAMKLWITNGIDMDKTATREEVVKMCIRTLEIVENMLK